MYAVWMSFSSEELWPNLNSFLNKMGTPLAHRKKKTGLLAY